MARNLTIFLLVTFAIVSTSRGTTVADSVVDRASADSLEITTLLQLADSLVYDEPISSLGYAETALALSEQLGDRTLMARAQYRRASALWSKGDLRDALEQVKGALSLAQTIEDLELVGLCYMRLGALYGSVEDNATALRYYRQALERFRNQRDWVRVASIFNNIGYTYLKSRRLDSAEHYLQRAYWLLTENPNILTPIVMFNLGEVEYLLGDSQAGKALLLECLVIATERQDRRATIRCNQLLAEIALASGEIEEAEKRSKAALDLAERSMVKELLYLSNQTRANVLFALGEYQSAFSHQKIAVAYRDSLQAADVKHRLSLFDFQLTEQELEELRTQNQRVEMKFDLQQVLILSISVIAGFALVLAYLFYRGRRLKSHANRLLELKNQQIASQARELEELNTFKTKLIAIISHDLKSPMQGLFSVTDMLQSKMVKPDELQEALPSLRTSLRDINHKINDLLKWSGGTMDDQYLKKEVVKVSEVVSATIQELKEDADHKNLGIIQSNLQGLKISTDPNILQTVVRNLLHNAIKFSRKGGEVAIRGWQKAEEVLLAITDHGVGMTEEQMKLLFKARKEVKEGTVGEMGSGIGLVICHDLLEMVGARLWAKSEGEGGSTFYVAFPVGEEPTEKMTEIAAEA